MSNITFTIQVSGTINGRTISEEASYEVADVEFVAAGTGQGVGAGATTKSLLAGASAVTKASTPIVMTEDNPLALAVINKDGLGGNHCFVQLEDETATTDVEVGLEAGAFVFLPGDAANFYGSSATATDTPDDNLDRLNLVADEVPVPFELVALYTS